MIPCVKNSQHLRLRLLQGGLGEVRQVGARLGQLERFLEEGHRFFDLRRTGQLDAVMTGMAPVKGASWSAYKQWWPIPIADIQADPNLTQTPGY